MLSSMLSPPDRRGFLNQALEALNREHYLGLVSYRNARYRVELSEIEIKILESLKFLAFRTNISVQTICDEFRPIAHCINEKWISKPSKYSIDPPPNTIDRYLDRSQRIFLAPGQHRYLLQELRNYLRSKIEQIRTAGGLTRTLSVPLYNATAFRDDATPTASQETDIDGFEAPPVKTNKTFINRQTHLFESSSSKRSPFYKDKKFGLAERTPASAEKNLNVFDVQDVKDAPMGDASSKYSHKNDTKPSFGSTSMDYSNTTDNQKDIYSKFTANITDIDDTFPGPFKAKQVNSGPVRKSRTFGRVHTLQPTCKESFTISYAHTSNLYPSIAPGALLKASKGQSLQRATPSIAEPMSIDDILENEPILPKPREWASSALVLPRETKTQGHLPVAATRDQEHFDDQTIDVQSDISDDIFYPELTDLELQEIADISDGMMLHDQSQSPQKSVPMTSPSPTALECDIPINIQSPTYSQTQLMATRQNQLAKRLQNVFPPLPPYLEKADFAVIWEVVRAALYCGVDLSRTYMNITQATSQQALTSMLHKNPLFKGRELPPPSDNLAFETARNTGHTRGQVVMFVGHMSWSTQQAGPLFTLQLNPLRIERGCRLRRRFGPDRFLELSFPYPKNNRAPKHIREVDPNAEIILQWLVNEKPNFLGRQWAAFFTRDTKINAGSQELETSWFNEKKVKAINVNRVYFFAEDGKGFNPTEGIIETALPSKELAKRPRDRFPMSRQALINWAVQPWQCNNRRQPALKLFSRLALSLSGTFATVTFEYHQIIHEVSDIISPTSQVMNDGIGTMSKKVAAMIASYLGLDHVPCGYQGRIGSAKGFWIIHPDEPARIWIRTYPSQRKWVCDDTDPDHRTFEVHSEVRSLSPAALNTQFIPVLSAQSRDPSDMVQRISEYFEETINYEMAIHKFMDSDNVASYLKWIHADPLAKIDRITTGNIPYLGGLPRNDYERIKFLLSGGFNPMEQRYLFDLIKTMVESRCMGLKEKLRIKIPQSTYAYMTVDFLGVLEEGEIHLGFSKGFQVSEHESVQLLHGEDVLVARSPAHFPSDIQRVKAVFRPELRHLTDVVVFSAKGDRPLADLLSGGDYDGDMAWVCWDERIVQNFENAPPPPDLFLGLEKDEKTFAEIDDSSYQQREDTVDQFLLHAFMFNMNESMLGLCTTYKEYLCYELDSVKEPQIAVLSTLLGYLVDQMKQGYIFGHSEWLQFQDSHGFKPGIRKPQYHEDRWEGTSLPRHVLDHLKFTVALPAIENVLKAFQEQGKQAMYYDPHLSAPSNELEKWCEPVTGALECTQEQNAWKDIRRQLNDDINMMAEYWNDSMAKRDLSYAERVELCHSKFESIQPFASALQRFPTIAHMLQLHLPDSMSTWGFIKASRLFRNASLRKSTTLCTMSFVLAGRQLQQIKAREMARVCGDAVVCMTSEMYAVHQPDRRMIAGLGAHDEAAGYANTSVASHEDLLGRILDDNVLLSMVE